MQSSKAKDNIWESQANIIRAFIDQQPLFEKLGEEVAYVLKKAIEENGIKYSTITHRAKTLDSFCEKIDRKSYSSPLQDITDLSGVRLVYLYHSDLARISSIIEDQFKIVEKVDKINEREDDHFGYGALHYLVKIGKKLSGARYDDLKDLLCEIQVRTILQDSWAIVAHHLSYKKETDVPKQLRRKLNALSGLFETADDQFDRIRVEREGYIIKSSKEFESHTANLHQELNVDNLDAYLRQRFPNRKSSDTNSIAELHSELSSFGVKTIQDVEKLLAQTETAIRAYETKYPPFGDTFEHCPYNAIGAVRVALQFIDYSKYRQIRGSDTPSNKKIDEFKHLVVNNE